jgi:GT2 family glycosyltransferase
MNQAPIVLAHPSDSEGRGHYRIIHPAHSLHVAGLCRSYLYTKFMTEEGLKALNPNTVVFSEHESNAHLDIIKTYRKTIKNALFVYDINDLLTDVPEKNIHKANVPLDIGKRQREALRYMDAVTVTTDELAEDVRRKFHFKDVRVVPNMIPKHIFDSVTPSTTKNSKPRIGWAGGISHSGDTEIVQHIADALGDSVQWVFFGMMPEGMGHRSNVEFVRPVPMEHYYAALSVLNLDVAIAPVEINRFNECKSNLKLLEYGLLNIPVVATDIAPYQNSPATLVQNTVDEWVDAIRAAISGKTTGLRSWVEANFILENNASDRMKGWLPKGETPFVPSEASGKVESRVVTDVASIPTNSDVFLTRNGATFSAPQMNRLAVNDATMAIHNNGMFPVAGQFTPIDPVTAEFIDGLAAAHNDTVDVAVLGGPVVFMSAKALNEVGTPATDYDTEEAMLMDWSMRASQRGYKIKCAANVYVTAQQPSQISDSDKNRLAARFPSMDTSPSQGLTDSLERVELGFYGEKYKVPFPKENTYKEWCDTFDTPRPTVTSFGEVCIGVVMPTYNTPGNVLGEAVKSLIEQSYQNWKLAIVDDGSTNEETLEYLRTLDGLGLSNIFVQFNAENKGISSASNAAIDKLVSEGVDWITFLDHDDTLSPIALDETVKAIRNNGELALIYSDEDKLDQDGNRCEPFFKPAFDYERLLSQNYVSHYSAYRVTEALPRLDSSFDGSQDYNFLLHHLESFGNDRSKIHHIPRVLYHWRKSETSMAHNQQSKPEAVKQAVRSIIGHLKRTGQSGMVSTNPMVPSFQRVQFGVPEAQPKVTIIIPTKDKVELLKPCIDSIIAKTVYTNYEIVVIDNGSRDVATVKYLNGLKGIRVIRDASPYNFSALNNMATKACEDTDFYVFLNNDTEVHESGWLNQMVGMALRPGVGSVGAKLLYPDGRVQHAGVQRRAGLCMHTGAGHPMQYPGAFGINVLNHESCSVTAACMMVKKDVWEELGGFNEDYPVYFNDVDLGFRLMKAGYRNVICADAILIHKESASLGREMTPEKQGLLNEAGLRLNSEHPEADPYLNPQSTFDNTPVWPAPWVKVESIVNALIINGSDSDATAAFQNGQSAYMAETVGAIMRIQKPALRNIKSWDMRVDVEAAKTALRLLGITSIIVKNLGDGLLEMLPFVERLGIPVVYDPDSVESACPRNFADCDKALMEAGGCQTCIDANGSPFGYVDIDGWRNLWGRFLMNTYNDKGDAASLLAYVCSREG